MKTRVSYLLAVLITAISCVNDDVSTCVSGTEEFFCHIENEESTKTSLDQNNNVMWSAEDQLVIFKKSTIPSKYQISENCVGKTSGSFYKVNSDEFNAGSEIDHNVALYPYQEDMEIAKLDSDSPTSSYKITGYNFPVEQVYVENSFANGSFPMAAVSDNYDLVFRNICGGIKLQLKGTQKVISIKIQGNNNEKLAGPADITVYSDEMLKPAIAITYDALTHVTLNCGDGVQLDESTATEFIIALPPVLFSNGFTVTVTDSDSQTYTVETDKANTVLRSSLLVMPDVTLGESAGEDSGDGGDDDGVFTLKVDKQIITSNGTDAAVLTPLFNGKAVTEGVTFYDGVSYNVVQLDGGRFVTEENGTYSFWASYKTFTSNIVTITSVPTEVPATPDDPKPSSTSFVKRVLLTKFTGAGCPFSPAMTSALHNILDEHELAPYVVKAEAHTYSGGYDPALLSGFYSVNSWPTVIVDWAQYFVPTSGVSTQAAIENMIEDCYAEPAKAGLSLNAKHMGKSIVTKVCVKAAEDGDYCVGAWLLEDGIEAQQSVPEGGTVNEIFDDCIRYADSKRGASNFAGKKLGTIKAGQTAEMMFIWNDVLKDSWNVENLELCVFVSVQDGNKTTVTNAIKAPISGEVKYEYAK